jgi:hypothetical protein
MDKYRHYDLIINPYEVNGNRSVLVTTRDICEAPAEDAPYNILHRGLFYDFLGNFHNLGKVLNHVLGTFPKAIPQFIEKGIGVLARNEYVDRSYRVLNLGSANYIQGCSAELAFPVTEDNSYIAAVEKIFGLLKEYVANGEQYITSPVAMRFVKASEHYLSMMHEIPGGHDCGENDAVQLFCLVEMPVISFSVGGLEILERIEKEMYKHSARPHWGQVNFISGSHIKINKLYNKLETWREVYQHFNAKGIFSNEFTYRCGFDPALLETNVKIKAIVAEQKAKNDAIISAND